MALISVPPSYQFLSSGEVLIFFVFSPLPKRRIAAEPSIGVRRVKRLPAFAAALFLCLPVIAQQPYHQSSPERQTAVEKDWGVWLGPFRAKLVPKLMEDFGEQYIYAPLNAKLPPPAPGEGRVVFYGDSITDLWNLPVFFPGKPYINRGIGSQVTAQLVLRFHSDVVALHPRAVVILAGVNDVQGFLQQMSLEQIEANFAAMEEMARANRIHVIFCSVLPVNNYTDNAKTVLEDRHPEELRQLNAWLKSYAASHHAGYVDYYTPLADEHGLLRRELTHDGIHPTAEGYAIMAPLAQKAIDEALQAADAAQPPAAPSPR
jgi:lysophospholipase L1-like esterase